MMMNKEKIKDEIKHWSSVWGFMFMLLGMAALVGLGFMFLFKHHYGYLNLGAWALGFIVYLCIEFMVFWYDSCKTPYEEEVCEKCAGVGTLKRQNKYYGYGYKVICNECGGTGTIIKELRK